MIWPSVAQSQRALLKHFNSERIERTRDPRNSSSVPVTATIAPIRWQPSTMMSFCCGEVRANTISVWYLRISSSWSEFSSLSSVPWMTAAFASRGLTSDTGIFNRWAMSSTVSLPDQRILLSAWKELREDLPEKLSFKVYNPFDINLIISKNTLYIYRRMWTFTSSFYK